MRKALLSLSLQKGRITPIYESDDFGSYLIIKPEEDSLIEYQVEMISNNCIPGLLTMDLRCKNNEKYLYYKITSMIPLSRFLSRKKINKRQLLSLLNQITQTMLTGIDYLLYNKCYILEQDFIYMDPASFKLYMVYLPMAVEGDVNQNLRKLIIDLIVNATYIEDDDQGDGFIRKIINYIKGDTFNIIGFNKLLKQLNQENCQENIPDAQRTDGERVEMDNYAGYSTYKYGLTDAHEIGDEFTASEDFLPGEINGDSENNKEGLQNKTKGALKDQTSSNCYDRLSKQNSRAANRKINDFGIIAIGAATQIILTVLFLLSRNFLETLGGDIKTTYAAAILIIIAVDALVIKNLLDYRKNLKKQSHKSGKNTRNETSTQKEGNKCSSENNTLRRENNEVGYENNALGYKSNATRIGNSKNNKIAEKLKNEINYGKNYGEIIVGPVVPFKTENGEGSRMVSPNYIDNKDSPWMPNPEYSSKTVVLSPKKELKPYIINMAGGTKGEIPIDKKEFLIGRLEDMVDCVIKNAAVGKVHALITEQNGKYYLKDLNSVNGTMVNDVRLQCNEEKELKDGDRITFANCDYLFVFR